MPVGSSNNFAKKKIATMETIAAMKSEIAQFFQIVLSTRNRLEAEVETA